jgi:RNA polymerase sigma factor (sigma-70 family)
LSTADKQAFVAAVAHEHGRRLRRFVAARLRNAADVPDLVQEVFLRLLRIPTHETIRTPEAYLLTIAGHVCHQHTLRQAAAPEAIDIADAIAESEALVTPDSAEELDMQREVQALERVLSELPENVRACFILQRLYGYSLDEIVAHVGIARSTVKKYLVLAITHCQKRLASRKAP